MRPAIDKNDGGPAFAVPEDPDTGYPVAWTGMTLRQWYAGHALGGLAASMNDDDFHAISDGTRTGEPEARVARALADALLRIELKED